MYLILTDKEAEERNCEEACKRGCKTTKFWWNAIKLKDGYTALDVGDGDGLSKDELKDCVDKLP